MQSGQSIRVGAFLWGVIAFCGLLAGAVRQTKPAWASEEAPTQSKETGSSEPLTFVDGRAEVSGVTAGSESLTQIAARDRRRKLCLGYSDSDPDYILSLTEEQARLRIAVSSEGQDTTLLIQGPRGIDCNDNHSRDHRDAAVTATDWPAGTYQIWVGSFEEGDRVNYTLSISDTD